MTDKNNSKNLHSGEIKAPRLGWSPIIIHLMLASVISWGVFTYGEFLGVKYWLDIVAGVIPSITGLSLVSPNPDWAKLYMLACWVGAPLYMIFIWRASEAIYKDWIWKQAATRFWLLIVVCVIFIISMLFIPTTSRSPTDAAESVRLTALLTSLMKENYLVFSIVGYFFVFSFSIMAGAVSKLIQIRLFKK